MTRVKLEETTIDELVQRFAEIGVAQDQALLYERRAEFRQLFRQMNDIDSELRRRGNDARAALLPLYRHPNMQVRLKAAVKTLAVAPDLARQVIGAVYGSGCLPQSLDAGMTLRNLESGVFKPD